MQINVHASIGGTRRNEEIALLRDSPPHIVVGTPGRIFDMMDRRAISKFTLSLLCIIKVICVVVDQVLTQINGMFKYFEYYYWSTIMCMLWPWLVMAVYLLVIEPYDHLNLDVYKEVINGFVKVNPFILI